MRGVPFLTEERAVLEPVLSKLTPFAFETRTSDTVSMFGDVCHWIGVLPYRISAPYRVELPRGCPVELPPGFSYRMRELIDYESP